MKEGFYGNRYCNSCRWRFLPKKSSLYAKGERKTRIIDALREKGWRTRDGKPFTLNSLTTLLKNPKYIGVLQQSGVSIEGGCPAIVEPEVFEQVQRRLAQNRKQGAKNKAKMEYLLTGRLFCGYCGAGMQGVSGTGRDGDRRHYYQCPTRRNRKTCRKHNEKKDFLEWYVVEHTTRNTKVRYIFFDKKFGLILYR